jgi:hypothetical protein
MVPLGHLILQLIRLAFSFVFEFVFESVIELAFAFWGAPVFAVLAKAGLPLTLPFPVVKRWAYLTTASHLHSPREFLCRVLLRSAFPGATLEVENIRMALEGKSVRGQQLPERLACSSPAATDFYSQHPGIRIPAKSGPAFPQLR